MLGSKAKILFYGRRMKKLAIVSSLLAALGGIIYYIVMSIGDIFKNVGDPFEEEFEDEF